MAPETMKGCIMRTGTADRRNRILETLAPDRQSRVKELKQRILDGRYSLSGKMELVFDDLVDEAVRMRS
jgi:anti-sigma28 factor (negative regulator of flagellin synthesis)